MKRTCIQCGAEFEIQEKEAAFYESKDFELPKRCKECRQKNKMAQRQQRNNYDQNRNMNRQNYRPKYQGQNTEHRSYQPNYQGKRSNGSQPYWKTYGEWQNESATASKQRGTTNQSAYTSGKKKTSKGWIAAVLAIVLLLCGGGTGYWYHEQQQENTQVASSAADQTYQFRNDNYLTEHFEKHGAEMGYSTKESYLEGANRVIASTEALHKQEAEDGDDIYFLEKTDELVVVSTDGYIRTYFKPEDGMAYYNKQ